MSEFPRQTESVRDDPWKVLIAVRLLNVTTGKAAIPVFCKIISRWPTPQDLVRGGSCHRVCLLHQADVKDPAPQDALVELLRPLGLYNKRARWLKDVSERFLEDRDAPSCSLGSILSDERSVPAAPRLYYPGAGPYARDSLRIFCAGDEDAWKDVMPRDKELVRYLVRHRVRHRPCRLTCGTPTALAMGRRGRESVVPRRDGRDR
jgi:hypothetical protein